MILGVVALTIPLLTGLAPQCDPFLAVAQPYATVDGQVRAGAVRILDGPLITQDDPEPGDMFGSALATGDFDGDGCADLAIGASEEDAGPGGRDGHGVVEILYGLTSRRTIELPGKGADRFGAALAAGDLDGDGDDELAIGAPGGGAVYVHGQGSKPRRIKNTGGAVTDQFGEALATGDFDGDGTDELAIGAPGANLIRQGEGTVTVVGRNGRRLLYSQETYGIDGLSESWDAFGAALATGDFNADGHDDLAIGVPGEGLNRLQRAGDYGEGAVDVVYGSPGGLRPATAEAWTQNSLAGEAVMYDRFGTSLAAGDLNGDGDDELVVGVPGENAVQVLAGTRSGGLTKNHNLLIPGPKGAEFGAAVLVHGGDLIVGAPTKGEVYRYRGGVKKGSYPGVGRKGEKIAEGDGFFGFGLG
ncbi:FG-GAP-like repeat-containing protein [Herbidospora yilanensis]|uniref:FG-GAP-like repeat-containing protein n=1 Tax=Herbidospora yilanensis TaxID=354426 RepID=UPI000781C90B|nr:FG-GAP-like repeat-containing protein [Herbidospora yilanensis]